jgi:hypothetical protein
VELGWGTGNIFEDKIRSRAGPGEILKLWPVQSSIRLSNYHMKSIIKDKNR